jgi:hypothetical protein
MAQTTVVTVTVEELSKYGFKANGRYVGLSKQLPEGDKALIVPGVTFEAEFYIADSGKEYLNKILKTKTAIVPMPHLAVSDVNPPVDVARVKKFTPKFKKEDKGEAMTRADWDNKDRRISRQGAIQAAVIALAPVVSLEQLSKEAKLLASEMLDFVNS